MGGLEEGFGRICGDLVIWCAFIVHVTALPVNGLAYITSLAVRLGRVRVVASLKILWYSNHFSVGSTGLSFDWNSCSK